MNLTIIGTGNMAKGIATRAINGGHTVTLHSRDAAAAQETAETLGATVASIGEALADDIVVLAVPYGEIENLADKYDSFNGKIVIDITNPVDFNTFQLIPDAGAVAVSKLLPEAKVVKAFNTIFAGTLQSGTVDGKPLDVLIAGDDVAAKQTVAELVNTSGMRGVDVGPLAHSAHLEGLALIHMSVQDQLQTGWMSTIKFLR